MNFPTLVYKRGGYHHAPAGKGTYSYALAVDGQQYNELLRDGWSDTLEAAFNTADKSTPQPSVSIHPHKAEPVPAPAHAVSQESAEPTDEEIRDELKARAKALGLSVRGNVGIDTLRARIAAAT